MKSVSTALLLLIWDYVLNKIICVVIICEKRFDKGSHAMKQRDGSAA